MKKILSFMLVLAMLAMMCINVSAAQFIGTRGDRADTNDSINDGVATFAPKPSESVINATVNNATASRYAVDLEYTVYDITIDGTATWDVNKLKYVGQFTISTSAESFTFNTEGQNTTTAIGVGTFTITNYSDLDVLASAAVDYPVEIPVSVAITGGNVDIATATATIDGVYDANQEQSSNTAKTASYTATMDSTDWANVAAILNHNYANNTSNKIATITITIAPANNAHAVDPDPSAGN